MLPVAKTAQERKISDYSVSWLASILKRMFDFCWLFDDGLGGWAMSQKMPLLSRVLGTAAFASVIVVLLMSYQWGRATESPMTQVIRLHPK
jgi:hypothetical protein